MTLFRGHFAHTSLTLKKNKVSGVENGGGGDEEKYNGKPYSFICVISSN